MGGGSLFFWRGGFNLQCKPTQVSGGRAPWSLHHENHLNGQRRGGGGSREVWPVCYGNSFSDTVTWLFHLSSDDSKSLQYADYTTVLSCCNTLPATCCNASAHSPPLRTVTMNFLSNTATTKRYDALQFLVVVMLQSLHRRSLAWCKSVLKKAEVATLRGAAGKVAALVCIRRYRSLLWLGGSNAVNHERQNGSGAVWALRPALCEKFGVKQKGVGGGGSNTGW